jgi:hypothetical protein
MRDPSRRRLEGKAFSKKEKELVGIRRTLISQGKYLNMKGIRGKPKAYGGTRPVIMNAGASPVG